MNDLGKLISNKRISKGFSVEEAAKIVGVSRMTLSRLEANKTSLIHISNIINISNYLEIDFCKMLIALKENVVRFDLKNAFKLSKKIYFNDTEIDRNKLEQIIENNINELVTNKTLMIK